MAEKIATNFVVSHQMLALVGSIMEKVGTFSTHGTVGFLKAASPAPENIDPFAYEAYEAYCKEKLGKAPKGGVKKIFAWVRKQQQSVNPLLLSSVFAYELCVLTPLEEQEQGIALAYMKALLGTFREVFLYISFEQKALSESKRHQEAILASGENADIAPYILFMLEEIEATLNEAQQQVSGFEGKRTPCVDKLLSLMELGKEYSSKDIQDMLGLKSRVAVKRNYLEPAMKGGYVQMLLPGKPHSPNQRYSRLK